VEDAVCPCSAEQRVRASAVHLIGKETERGWERAEPFYPDNRIGCVHAWRETRRKWSLDHSCIYSSLGGLSDSAFSVPLANQPRFMKKRIATATIAANTATSSMFANVMVHLRSFVPAARFGLGCRIHLSSVYRCNVSGGKVAAAASFATLSAVGESRRTSHRSPIRFAAQR
jgi:hypothetical protein